MDRSQQGRHREVLVVWNRGRNKRSQLEPFSPGFLFCFETLPGAFAAPVFKRANERDQGDQRRKGDQQPTGNAPQLSRARGRIGHGSVLIFHTSHHSGCRLFSAVRLWELLRFERG
jgi:hypothetical protein